MHTLKLQFYRKNVYGEKKKYFANPETQRRFTVLTGRKTFGTMDITHLEEMFQCKIEMEEVLPPNE